MNTPANTATTTTDIETLTTELTEACDQMYDRFDLSDMRAAAIAAGYETPDPRGRIDRDLLRMSVPMEELQVAFYEATDWDLLGEILDRAGVPYAACPRQSLDRFHNKSTGLYDKGTSGQPHSGDYRFGTVGGQSIEVLRASIPAEFPDKHPAEQIIEAARAYLVAQLDPDF